jgi:hypothetical protein
LPESSSPFGYGIGCFQVSGGEYGDGALRVLAGFVHIVYKVLSCREIPGLKNHGIASSLQLRANPFGPILVCVGVADEEIFFYCLSPFFSETLIYCRIVFFVIWYLSKNSIALSMKYLNCKSQKGWASLYTVLHFIM